MRQTINADNKDRIETGALRINDDWTGLFIRGDDCIKLRDILYDDDVSRGDFVDEIVTDTFVDMLIESIESDVFHK